MAAALTLFPLEVGRWGSSPRYSTDVIVGASGYEVRNANWQDPLYKYNAAFGVKTKADIEALHIFFHGVKGREGSFLVKDYQDFAVTEWTTFAETPNSSLTTFQLIKKYTHSVLGTYTRTITKPKQLEGPNGVSIRDNGVVMGVGNYSFSSSTGIVTFSSAPATGRTIDFKIAEFYVPVRFDTDELPTEMLMWWINQNAAERTLIELPDIPLVEVRGE